MSRLEEFENELKDVKRIIASNYPPENYTLLREALDWLIQQAKRVGQLEYASRHNGELNEFLQKRKLPPNTLGRHVVDVVMDYVEELEAENKRLNHEIGSYSGDIHEKARIVIQESIKLQEMAKKMLKGESE